MPLQVAYDASGLDGKLRGIIDQIVANIQVWANQVDGINAAERLSELTSGVASLPTVQTGLVLPYAGSTAPTGYLLCDGSAVSRTTYATLFAVTGTTYGAGDGLTTFNIPNLRQRFPLGKAASGTGATLGSTGGTIDHAHTLSGSTANESSHTHGAGSYATPTHNHTGETGDFTIGFTPDIVTVTDDGTSQVSVLEGFDFAEDTNPHDHTISTQAAMTITGTSGSGSSHNHGVGTLAAGTANPPYIALNYVIKT